jgi:hypothetical protein
MVGVVPTGAISQTGAGRSGAPTSDGSFVCDADPEDIGKHTIFLGGICETSQVNINKIIFKLGSYPLRFLETTWFTAPNGGVSVSPLYRLVSGLMNLGVVRDGGGDTASIPIRSASRQHVFLVYYT